MLRLGAGMAAGPLTGADSVGTGPSVGKDSRDRALVCFQTAADRSRGWTGYGDLVEPQVRWGWAKSESLLGVGEPHTGACGACASEPGFRGLEGPIWEP